MEMNRPRIEAVVCSECGGYFTPLGLRMHEGSEKCNLNKRAKPLTEATERINFKRKTDLKRPDRITG